MNSLCVRHLSVEVTKRTTDAAITHQQICNVLKYIRYIRRFDILGAERESSHKTIRYILKQLFRFGICVHEFRLIIAGPPVPVSKELIGINTALFDYLACQQQLCEAIDMGEDWFTDHVGEDGIMALFKCRHARIIVQFKDKPQQSLQEYPLYLSHNDHVYGNLFLSAEGTILNSSGQVLCPANQFKHYLNSTSDKKKAVGKKDQKIKNYSARRKVKYLAATKL